MTKQFLSSTNEKPRPFWRGHFLNDPLHPLISLAFNPMGEAELIPLFSIAGFGLLVAFLLFK